MWPEQRGWAKRLSSTSNWQQEETLAATKPFDIPKLWVAKGSVSTRASKYSLGSRTCGDVQSCGFQDGQHRHGAAEELESAAIGGNVLMVAGARAEKVAQCIVSPAEPGGRSGTLE